MNRFKRIIFIFNALAFSSTLLAQMTVSGTVSDAVTGRPLSQVNVIVEGTNKGSATDNNGNFTIGNVTIVEGGKLSQSYDENLTAKYMKSENIEINIEIFTGNKSFTAYTMDLTKKYIEINADYRS